jgi:transcriptional regulator with XRE-family HTH domain
MILLNKNILLLLQFFKYLILLAPHLLRIQMAPLTSTHPLGHALRDFRVRLGYTQKKLAELSGYGEPFLSRIENGYLQPTRTDILDRLAEALQLTETERSELITAAWDSQKTIRVPVGLSLKGCRALHRFSRSVQRMREESVDRIMQRILEEEEKIPH